MSDRNAKWHARYQNGESAADIAQDVGKTRSAVSGAIRRHTQQLKKSGVDQQSAKAARAEMREDRKSLRGPAKPPVSPEAIQAFDSASQGRRCLWIDGDPRDGSAVVCGHHRTKPAYCDAHHARAHDGRPRSLVAAP